MSLDKIECWNCHKNIGSEELKCPYCGACQVCFELETLEKSQEKGKKFDEGKIMVDLLVPEWLEDMARILTFGAKKYGLENWKNNLESRRILAALYRHVLAYHRGEKLDPETGLSHLCHVAINAMFLYWYDEKKKDEVCIFCGFNCTEYEKQCKEEKVQPSGRQWAGGFSFGDSFICGSCGDELRWRFEESPRKP